MNAVAPALVVSVPARSVKDARVQAQEAVDSGADLVEIRFDRFPTEERVHAADLFPSPCPLIATLRSTAEGGEGPDEPESRARILEGLAHAPFRWIDVEAARDLRSVEPLLQDGLRGLIVSSHRRTPVRESEWSQLVRFDVPSGAIRKVVAPATVVQLVRELIPALPPVGEAPLVAHTTGPSGPLLRAWARRFGFPFVYASLPARAGHAERAPVESSQIPVDRLGPFLRADGTPPLFALAGHPVAHSRSPGLHGGWMRERGETGLYLLLDFESERDFVDSIPFLVEGGFRGLNVTHPFKAVALELASRVSPGASACGVANTLSLGSDEIEADNTDLAAILRRFEELEEVGRWDGASVGVVGAGGAARATLAAARSRGIDAWVWARRPEAAEGLARDFGATASPDFERSRPTLVVHATTVGMDPRGHSGLAELGAWLRPGVHLLDWVYAPSDPQLRVSAERHGASYEDGSRLLVYQAAASYGLWWGEPPSPAQVAASLEGFA
jgi:shikimate dehydrogenase/3-dehydroquinate dehydratase type I